jgi:hypothetical protein
VLPNVLLSAAVMAVVGPVVRMDTVLVLKIDLANKAFQHLVIHFGMVDNDLLSLLLNGIILKFFLVFFVP